MKIFFSSQTIIPSFLEAIKKAAEAAFFTGISGLFFSCFCFSFNQLLLQSNDGEIGCLFKCFTLFLGKNSSALLHQA